MLPQNCVAKFSFVLLDILCSKGDCILLIHEMVSAYRAAKQIGCISSVFNYKVTNIKKHMKEANDFSMYCDNKPAKTTCN